MKDIVLRFLKAEVVNYYVENGAFDMRVLYDVEGKQKQLVQRVTKENKDLQEFAEKAIIDIRKLEKQQHSIAFGGEDPLSGFVNIKVIDEDEVPERLARFAAKVITQSRMNNYASVPRYLVREQICKLSANL